MIRRTLFILVLCSAIVAAFPTHLSAQENEQPISTWCTITEVDVRACPYWHDCAVTLTYDPDTLLLVRDTATGDRDYGSDLWLVVEDPLQGIEGYIHSTRARACAPQSWQLLPIVPDMTAIGAAMRAVYARGLALGNDPHAFSKVGDCQNVEAYFLSH
ncbi:MAG: hypothetical protein JXA10_01255, partial [Anaerolineae bacterium]|nr:hypothetical protein [Anaerolineae bacterium]